MLMPTFHGFFDSVVSLVFLSSARGSRPLRRMAFLLARPMYFSSSSSSNPPKSSGFEDPSTTSSSIGVLSTTTPSLASAAAEPLAARTALAGVGPIFLKRATKNPSTFLGLAFAAIRRNRREHSWPQGRDIGTYVLVVWVKPPSQFQARIELLAHAFEIRS